jgi:parallel beta-helix repeat protein
VSLFMAAFNEVYKNEIKNLRNNNNRYGTGIGLSFIGLVNNKIYNNNIDNCDMGISLYGEMLTESNFKQLNKIYHNTIQNNIYGIYLTWNPNGNLIYQNNLINNGKDGEGGNVYDDGSNNWYKDKLTGGNGNYYDDWEENEGYPNSYSIPGGDNIDLYPLSKPYTGSSGGSKSKQTYLNIKNLVIEFLNSDLLLRIINIINDIKCYQNNINI